MKTIIHRIILAALIAAAASSARAADPPAPPVWVSDPNFVGPWPHRPDICLTTDVEAIFPRYRFGPANGPWELGGVAPIDCRVATVQCHGASGGLANGGDAEGCLALLNETPGYRGSLFSYDLVCNGATAEPGWPSTTQIWARGTGVPQLGALRPLSFNDAMRTPCGVPHILDLPNGVRLPVEGRFVPGALHCGTIYVRELDAVAAMRTGGVLPRFPSTPGLGNPHPAWPNPSPSAAQASKLAAGLQVLCALAEAESEKRLPPHERRPYGVMNCFVPMSGSYVQANEMLARQQAQDWVYGNMYCGNRCASDCRPPEVNRDFRPINRGTPEQQLNAWAAYPMYQPTAYQEQGHPPEVALVLARYGNRIYTPEGARALEEAQEKARRRRCGGGQIQAAVDPPYAAAAAAVEDPSSCGCRDAASRGRSATFALIGVLLLGLSRRRSA